MKRIIFLVFILNGLLLAQVDTNSKSINAYVLPIFSGAPETSWRFGITSRFLFDFYKNSETRKSNAKTSLSYTGLDQIIFESNWIYFFENEKYVTRGAVNFSDFTEFYYGTGETDLNNEIRFDFFRTEANFSFLFNLGKDVFFGPIYSFLEYDDIDVVEGETQYQELRNSSRNLIGATFLLDERNNLLNPQNGSFFEFLYAFNATNDNHNYHRFNIDYRYYHTFLNRFTIASRSINFININDAPFYDLALIGGEEIARGYLLGRHRSNNMMSLQTEFRFPFPGVTINLPWIGDYEFIWGFGVFGGLSKVFDSFDNFVNASIFPNSGISLKWMIDKAEKINIRIDYGVGRDGENGLYIKFGESF